MCYKLTLTYSERKAIDWVGYRDWNGDKLYRHLWVESQLVSPTDAEDWDDKRDMTFDVPENVAWEIATDVERNDGTIPHFADELESKIQAFLNAIV